MRTRSQSRIYKPKIPLSLTVSSAISPLPTSYKQALHDPHWRDAMLKEFNAFIKIELGILFPAPPPLPPVPMLSVASGFLSISFRLTGPSRDTKLGGLHVVLVRSPVC